MRPLIAAVLLAATAASALAQESYPSRAAQNLGAEVVARAAPDGYTLLATPQGPLVISQHFYPALGFDPTAFVPVTVLAALPYTLVAHPGVRASTLLELVALAKANPEKLTYASPGMGSPTHLAGELLKGAAGIRMTHVPYKGVAPAAVDLLAGRVDLMFDNLANVLPHIAAGWYAVVAPPKTSAEIAAKLSAAIGETLRLPDVRLRENSVRAVGSAPDETAAFFKQESERRRQVIVANDIKPD